MKENLSKCWSFWPQR